MSRALAGRFGFLSLLAITLTLPFAVPALWDYVQTLMELPRGAYLVRPVTNQVFYLQIAIGAVLLPFAAWRVYAPPLRLPRNSIQLFTLILIIVQLIACTYATSPGFAFRGLLLQMSFFAGFWILQTVDMDRRGIELTMIVALVAACVAGLYAICQSQGLEFLPYNMDQVSAKQRVSSTFGHPNYLASYLAPLAPWAVYMALSRGWRGRRFLGILSFICIALATLVAGTRGAWLAIIVAAVPYYLLMCLAPRFRRQLIFAGGLGIVIVAAVLFLPNPIIKIQFNLGQRLRASQEVTERFYYWMMALEQFKSHPWTGVGYGNFNVMFWSTVDTFQQQSGSDFFRYVLTENVRGVLPGYVHNDYLQIATESGVFAILAWLAMWSFLLCQTWETARRVRNNPRTLLMAATFLASFVIFAVDSMFNFPMHLPVSGWLFWILLASWVVFRDDVRRVTTAASSPSK